MRRKNRRPTNSGLEILRDRYFKGRPQREAILTQIRADDAVGRKIYELRSKAGLSQRELAKLVGTTASVICRLEDADYAGHSLAMLHRIARALKRVVQINFVSIRRSA